MTALNDNAIVTITNTYRKITMNKTDAKQSSIYVNGATYKLLRLNDGFYTYFSALSAEDQASFNSGLASDYSTWKYNPDQDVVAAASTGTKTTAGSGALSFNDADITGGLTDGYYFFYETTAATGYEIDNSITTGKIIHITGSGTDYVYSASNGAYTDPLQTKSLKLQKLYQTGSASEVAAAFPYQVTLTRNDSVDLTQYINSTTAGTLPTGAMVTTNTAAQITFTVSVTKGTDITIGNIPYGTNYSVSELLNTPATPMPAG